MAMIQDYPTTASTDAYNVTYATMYQPTFTKVEPRLVTGTFLKNNKKNISSIPLPYTHTTFLFKIFSVFPVSVKLQN